jgi:hypothetical protein
MARRQIDHGWVERVALTPLWTEPDTDHLDVERRFGVIAEFGGRVLRVAVRETKAQLFVLTTVFDRGARKRLRRGERP